MFYSFGINTDLGIDSDLNPYTEKSQNPCSYPVRNNPAQVVWIYSFHNIMNLQNEQENSAISSCPSVIDRYYTRRYKIGTFVILIYVQVQQQT